MGDVIPFPMRQRYVVQLNEWETKAFASPRTWELEEIQQIVSDLENRWEAIVNQKNVDRSDDQWATWEHAILADRWEEYMLAHRLDMDEAGLPTRYLQPDEPTVRIRADLRRRLERETTRLYWLMMGTCIATFVAALVLAIL